MLRTADLDYHLPEELIATHPAHPRDAARLLVISRGDPSRMEHRHVRELPEFLRRGDVLVLNTTRVLPARFRGVRADTGGKADGLYLGPAPHPHTDAGWAVLIKARRIKPGVLVSLLDREGRRCGLGLRILERHHHEPEHPEAPRLDTGELAAADEPESGGWIARLERERDGADAAVSPDAPAAAILERLGFAPLPPYIRQARKRHGEFDADPALHQADREEYQTVFADPHRAQSIAAPTAGLHFTPELLARLEDQGVQRAEVVLHVGMGTFKPVETEFIQQHPMHAEWCEIPARTATILRDARERGGRIVAVGTTTARTLESFPDLLAAATSGTPLAGWTRILIAPGHPWRNMDVLLTNFHLPRSTLLAMVASLLPAATPQQSVQRLLHMYEEAVRQRYRFYSYGDAMLILP